MALGGLEIPALALCVADNLVLLDLADSEVLGLRIREVKPRNRGLYMYVAYLYIVSTKHGASCHTCERVIMSHSCMRHVTHSNESIHRYKCVVMADTWMREKDSSAR